MHYPNIQRDDRALECARQVSEHKGKDWVAIRLPVGVSPYGVTHAVVLRGEDLDDYLANGWTEIEEAPRQCSVMVPRVGLLRGAGYERKCRNRVSQTIDGRHYCVSHARKSKEVLG